VGLARPAETISLREIVRAVDGPDAFDRCVLGLDRCGGPEPCPFHREWAAARERFESFLANTSLRALADHLEASGSDDPPLSWSGPPEEEPPAEST
jgi:DNA-binding IscR family transcriptional regulator